MMIEPDVMRSERCAAAFDKMFWAYIFFFDFRYGFNGVSIDLLPNVVGWILMASALSSILDLSPAVLGIRTFANWLIFLSLFSIINFKTGESNAWSYFLAPIGLATVVLTILFIWRLCELIMGMAKTTGSATLYDRAQFRRNIYVAFDATLFVLTWVCMAVPSLAVLFVFVGFPLSIVIFCLMMGLMKGTARVCRGEIV